MDVLNIKKRRSSDRLSKSFQGEEWRNACIQTTQDWNAATFAQHAAPSYCTLVVGCGALVSLALKSTNQGSNSLPKATSALNSF